MPIEHFNRFELPIFLGIEGDYFKSHRWVEEVYSSNGSSEHTLIFNAGENKRVTKDTIRKSTDPAYVDACRDFLRTVAPSVRTIEDTRRHVIGFLRGD